MKILTIITSVFLAVLLTSCSDDSSMEMSSMNKMETAVEHGAKHADANYVCPMQPQIIST